MITMKDIVRDPEPILRKKVSSIESIDQETIDQLKDMRDYLVRSQNSSIAEKEGLRPGVGLAAPQVGLDKRMLAIYILGENDEVEHDYMLINPKMKSHSVAKTFISTGEGCLSVDEDIEGLVHRYKRIKVEATNIDGEKVTIKANGLLSIVLQHELDHLDGIMFYDHIDKDFPMQPQNGAVAYDR